MGSTRMRERERISEGELSALYAERVEDKCILFADSSAQVSVGEKEIVIKATAQKGRLALTVLKKSAVTDPEKYIRDRRRLKEVIDGTADND